jgi:hypothetical protein
MFGLRNEATPVPSKGSRVSQSELRWLFHQLPTAGIPRVNRPQREVEIIDLTADDDDMNSEKQSESGRCYPAHERHALSDDEQPSQLHMRPSSSSISHFSPLPIRQRQTSIRRPLSPERNPAQRPDEQARQNSRIIPRQSEQVMAPANKRKESESAEDDNVTETWSAKRLRARKEVPAVEIGAGGATIFVDDSEDDLMESIEDDDEESEGEDYEVERVIAEKTGHGVHEYLIGWVGYDELSWIPASNCDCEDLTAEFRAVPRVRVIAESLASKEWEDERVRRMQKAAEKRAAKPPTVKPPRVPGVGSIRNPKTGRFEKRKVGDCLSEIRKRLESQWRGIQSDDESDGDLMSDDEDVGRNAAANTARALSTNSSPAHCDALRKNVARLPSKAPSPQPNTPSQSKSGEVIWIRESTIYGDNNILEKPRHLNNPSHRPRQTAKWIRETPDVDHEQSSLVRAQKTVDMESVQSDATPASTHSVEVLGVTRSFVSQTTKPSMTSPTGECSTSFSRPEATTNTMQPWTTEMARVKLPAPLTRTGVVGEGGMRPQNVVVHGCCPFNWAALKGEVGGRRDSRRAQAKIQAPRQRTGPVGAAAAIEAEIASNEGSVGQMKQKVHDMLSNALSNAAFDPLRRASPGTTVSRARERSASSQTQAFTAEIQRRRVAKQDVGPVRSELRGDVGPDYAKGLVAMAKEYSEHPQNHPYRHRPETDYGFSLSSDSLVLPSIEK